jgi:hypothetical protein
MATKTITLSLSEFNDLLHGESYFDTIRDLEEDIRQDFRRTALRMF